jgi:DNA-binding transcriptional LysR family regulator
VQAEVRSPLIMTPDRSQGRRTDPADGTTEAGAERWRELEVRHLEALRTVARRGSFHAAAADLGYTQSAVSQQIAALERIVGASLFDRPGGRRPIALTQAGELLLRHADAMLARVRAAQADVDALAAGQSGTLRIGTYQSVGSRLLPALLTAFAARWPRVEIELRESASDRELWRLVEDGTLDLTFTMLPVAEGPLDSVELLQDPYLLVVAQGSPLARAAAPPSLVEIAALPLIGFRSCRNETRIDAQLRARGLEPHVVFRSDDNGTIQGLVAEGYGVALMPALTVDRNDDRVVTFPMGDAVVPRVIGLAWHRDRHRSAAAEGFAELVRETVPRRRDAPGPTGRSRRRPA